MPTGMMFPYDFGFIPDTKAATVTRLISSLFRNFIALPDALSNAGSLAGSTPSRNQKKVLSVMTGLSQSRSFH
jgi:hypothetical protein